jgi:hypothetical protein
MHLHHQQLHQGVTQQWEGQQGHKQQQQGVEWEIGWVRIAPKDQLGWSSGRHGWLLLLAYPNPQHLMLLADPEESQISRSRGLVVALVLPHLMVQRAVAFLR